MRSFFNPGDKLRQDKNFILAREKNQHCWRGRAYNSYKKNKEYWKQVHN